MTTQRQGTILKKCRKEAKISQKQMSLMAGVSKNHISAIERGLHRVNGNVLLVYMISCHIEPELLLDGSEMTMITNGLKGVSYGRKGKI